VGLTAVGEYRSVDSQLQETPWGNAGTDDEQGTPGGQR
jgi:hypothetical protein